MTDAPIPGFEEALAAMRDRVLADGGEFATLERGLRNRARFGPMGVFVKAVDQDRETGITRRDLELAWRRFSERGMLRREDVGELKDRGLIFALFALVPGVHPEPFGQGIRWVGVPAKDATS
ncbi:MAG TPA: hypothetical protein VNZ52_00860 [Candidatus Thermoplasmatota archaeon]|nr:hypothetical protein [Candidatus Thermoplasmatota archaeon]